MNDILTQMFSALFIVIILIFGLSLIYKKRQKSAGLIDIIEYRSFGQKMGIAAMRINKEIFIMGITPTDMKVIERFGEEIIEKPSINSAEKDKSSISRRIQRLKEMKESL
jgi:flagellar biogenesis protein FliO